MNAHVRRAVVLLSLFSVLASVFFAGKSYFVCPWMQRAVTACCCPSERAAADGPTVSRAPCCNRRAIESTASAPTEALRPTTSVPAASVFSGELVRIANRLDPGSGASVNVARERGAREGPELELFELHSTYLI